MMKHLSPYICTCALFTMLALIAPAHKSFHARAEESKTEKVQVDIENYVFKPMELNVAVGTTVIWVNHDTVPHDVTSKDAGFESDLFAQDESFSFTFSKPGAYPYLCAMHPKMTGTVVVH